MPVSRNSRTMAVSRRGTKPDPAQAFKQCPCLVFAEHRNRALGHDGGGILAVGLASSSSSSRRQVKSRWSARKRTEAVAAERVSICSAMKSST
jgi:hypothetical protein